MASNPSRATTFGYHAARQIRERLQGSAKDQKDALAILNQVYKSSYTSWDAVPRGVMAQVMAAALPLTEELVRKNESGDKAQSLPGQQ